LTFAYKKILNTNIGYKIGDELVTYTAFADNIALLAKNKKGVSVNTELLVKKLERSGFVANLGKSATMSIGKERASGTRIADHFLRWIRSRWQL